MFYIIPIIAWHGWEQHWWPFPHSFPDPSLWRELGSLNGIQMFIYGQWWRPATAIWLHAGIAHLVGNVFFGAIFLSLLARICGVGRAWLLACMGAVGGNVMSALIHPLGYTSVGFSSVVFASLGATAGAIFCHYAEKLFMPVAAAVAILAMLGTKGANTDYSAHICSLGCGFLLGILANIAQRKGWLQPSQWLTGAVALALPLVAWCFAFFCN